MLHPFSKLELMQTLRKNRDCYPISVSFMDNSARALALSTHGYLYSAIEIGSCPIFPKHCGRHCPTVEKQNWQVKSSYVMTLISSSQAAPLGLRTRCLGSDVRHPPSWEESLQRLISFSHHDEA